MSSSKIGFLNLDELTEDDEARSIADLIASLQASFLPKHFEKVSKILTRRTEKFVEMVADRELRMLKTEAVLKVLRGEVGKLEEREKEVQKREKKLEEGERKAEERMKVVKRKILEISEKVNGLEEAASKLGIIKEKNGEFEGAKERETADLAVEGTGKTHGEVGCVGGEAKGQSFGGSTPAHIITIVDSDDEKPDLTIHTYIPLSTTPKRVWNEGTSNEDVQEALPDESYKNGFMDFSSHKRKRASQSLPEKHGNGIDSMVVDEHEKTPPRTLRNGSQRNSSISRCSTRVASAGNAFEELPTSLRANAAAVRLPEGNANAIEDHLNETPNSYLNGSGDGGNRKATQEYSKLYESINDYLDGVSSLIQIHQIALQNIRGKTT